MDFKDNHLNDNNSRFPPSPQYHQPQYYQPQQQYQYSQHRFNVNNNYFGSNDHQIGNHPIINHPIISHNRPLCIPSAVSQRSQSYSSLYEQSEISPAKDSIKSSSTTKTRKVKSRSKSKSKSKKNRPSKNDSKYTKSSRRSSKSSSSNNSRSNYGSSNKEDYEVLDTVGCGSFAKVSRVRKKSTKEIVVWKELAYGAMSNKEKQMLCDEVNILRDLNHPNIVQFVDRIIDHENRKIYIVQEYCDGGDLASYIKLKKEKLPKMSGRISESFIWSVTSEIASALQHCHNHFNRHNSNNGKRRILHRDLKPGNVFLVKRRGTYSVKLGDFGLAKMLDASSIFAQTHVGTPYYMSPEQIQSKSYDEKSDIWSLGCIVYEMAMLSRPFKAENYLHLAEKIKLGVYKKVTTRNYSEELEEAISKMLTVDSKKRAKVEELLCLPRIQFTSKMLRLDRRYCQLKKKEHQLNAKISEFESKYKKKSLQLAAKEEQLKKKESELKQKEVFLSSKASSNPDSTNSRSTLNSNNYNDTSPTQGSLQSNHSEDNNTKNSKQQLILTPSTNFLKRAVSNNSTQSVPSTLPSYSTLNTSKTSTLPSSNADASIGEGSISLNHELTEKKEESPIATNSNSNSSNNSNNNDENDEENSNNYSVLDADITRQSISTLNDIDIESTQNVMDDARKFLMERVNLSDLNTLNENNPNNITSRSFDYILNETSNLNMNPNHSFHNLRHQRGEMFK